MNPFEIVEAKKARTSGKYNAENQQDSSGDCGESGDRSTGKGKRSAARR
jgi:hypothetical protein